MNGVVPVPAKIPYRGPAFLGDPAHGLQEVLPALFRQLGYRDADDGAVYGRAEPEIAGFHRTGPAQIQSAHESDSATRSPVSRHGSGSDAEQHPLLRLLVQSPAQRPDADDDERRRRQGPAEGVLDRQEAFHDVHRVPPFED